MNGTVEIQDAVVGEQRIWLAVIARTVEEWVSGSLRNQLEAEEYLFQDKSDFATVCAAAGLDPEALRGKLLRLKKNGAGPKPLNAPRTIAKEFSLPVASARAIEEDTIAA